MVYTHINASVHNSYSFTELATVPYDTNDEQKGNLLYISILIAKTKTEMYKSGINKRQCGVKQKENKLK